MNERGRLEWDLGDALVRDPTQEELDKLGAEWHPPKAAPVLPDLPEVEVLADGAGLEVAIREHGELGAVLVDNDHEFTGEDDI